jgi:magnesium transporter
MMRPLKITGGRLIEADGDANVLVYVNPDEAERKHLVEDLKLDEHTLASALDPDELARVESEPEHVALIFKQPRNYSSEDNYLFRVLSVGMFLFKDKLVFVTADDVTLFEGKPFARISSLPELMLKVLYRSVFHFMGHLKTINVISDSLEQQINRAMENKYLLNLFTLEKSLVYYLNAINANAKLIERIKISAGKFQFSPDNLELLDDLIIENTQCYEQAEVYSNILSSMMDARVSVVSNNLNLLMKTLNIITIGIMVPTLVVSAFSMNVTLPWGWQDWADSFWAIMGLAAVSVTLLILYMRYKRW